MINLVDHMLKPGTYIVCYDNGSELGEMEKDVSGYYVFWPDKVRRGFWDSFILRSLVELLDGLNAEWDAQVQRDLNK